MKEEENTLILSIDIEFVTEAQNWIIQVKQNDALKKRKANSYNGAYISSSEFRNGCVQLMIVDAIGLARKKKCSSLARYSSSRAAISFRSVIFDFYQHGFSLSFLDLFEGDSIDSLSLESQYCQHFVDLFKFGYQHLRSLLENAIRELVCHHTVFLEWWKFVKKFKILNGKILKK